MFIFASIQTGAHRHQDKPETANGHSSKNVPELRDFLYASDKTTMALVREIDIYSLSILMNLSDKEVQDRVFDVMSKAAVLMIQEEMYTRRDADKEEISGAYQTFAEIVASITIDKRLSLNPLNWFRNYRRRLLWRTYEPYGSRETVDHRGA